MLVLQSSGAPSIANDDYYIVHKDTGLDQLHFKVSLSDPVYASILEGSAILETTEQQLYAVQKINAGSKEASIACQLDLGDWQKNIFINIQDLTEPGFSHELNETAMLSYVLGNASGLSGWTATGTVSAHKVRQIEMTAPTPLEVITQMQKTFGVVLRFDTRLKQVKIMYPEDVALGQAYAVDSVNLREAPTYKGSGSNLCTRLYPIGKDGLGIASVNGGVPYVQNLSYTTRIICKVWKDERYEDAQSLKADAQAKVDAMAVPERSWQLKIIDLQRIDATAWNNLKIGLLEKIVLVDRNRGERYTVQIRQDKVYPYYPERTEITVSTRARSVQATVKEVQDAITNPNSELWQQIKAQGG